MKRNTSSKTEVDTDTSKPLVSTLKQRPSSASTDARCSTDEQLPIMTSDKRANSLSKAQPSKYYHRGLNANNTEQLSINTKPVLRFPLIDIDGVVNNTKNSSIQTSASALKSTIVTVNKSANFDPTIQDRTIKNNIFAETQGEICDISKEEEIYTDLPQDESLQDKSGKADTKYSSDQKSTPTNMVIKESLNSNTNTKINIDPSENAGNKNSSSHDEEEIICTDLLQNINEIEKAEEKLEEATTQKNIQKAFGIPETQKVSSLFVTQDMISRLEMLGIQNIKTHKDYVEGFIRDKFINLKLETGKIIEHCFVGGEFMVSPPTDQCENGVIIVTSTAKNKISSSYTLSQPIITVTTPNTRVNHVDEVINFVGTNDNFKLVYPSILLAKDILTKTREHTKQELYLTIGSTHSGAQDGLKNLVSILEKLNWQSIDEQYEKNSQNILNSMQVSFWDEPDLKMPLIPGMRPSPINLVNFNDFVIIPYQHTMRVTINEAEAILETFLALEKSKIKESITKLSTKITFVVKKDDEVTGKNINGLLALKDSNSKKEEEKFKGPQILEIETNKVDILEAYIITALSCLNDIKCIFVETSDFMFGGGNLHCATNRDFDTQVLGED